MDRINIKIGDLELRNNSKGEPLISIEMEIVDWKESGHCYTVARWKDGDLLFVGGRPFNVDLDVFLKLAKIGHNFIQDEDEF